MGNEDEDALSTSFEPKAFKLYTKRWLILLVLSLLQCSNAMIWLSYAPIADYTAEYYNTSPDTVNYLSLVYMIASAVFGGISAFILDYMGLRAGLMVGAWLNFVGAGIKFLSAFSYVLPHSALLPVAFVGQTLAALAQPYMMFASTKVAALWFPEEHRALANTVGSMANPLGILVGSLLAPALVKPTAGDIHTDELSHYFQVLLGVHMAPSGIAALLSLFVTSKPPTPPSASAEEESMPFVAGMKNMFKIKAYWVLMISCGAGIALFTCLTTVLQQEMCPLGYSDTFAGTCSAIMIAAGIVGAVVTGVLADKTKKFEEIAKTFLAFAVVSFAGFMVAVRYPNVEGLIAFTVGAFGFFGFGLYPICLEMGVEITYPVAEATSTAFIIISGQIQGIVYLIAMQALAIDFTSPYSVCLNSVATQDFKYSNIFFVAGAFVIACFLIICFKANYKRMRAEQEAAAQRILGFTSSDPPSPSNS